MDLVLRNLVGAKCYVYIDIIVFSNMAQEHAQRLENILLRFDKAKLQLHPKKCTLRGENLRLP
jgi:hypothetical protein